MTEEGFKARREREKCRRKKRRKNRNKGEQFENQDKGTEAKEGNSTEWKTTTAIEENKRKVTKGHDFLLMRMMVQKNSPQNISQNKILILTYKRSMRKGNKTVRP